MCGGGKSPRMWSMIARSLLSASGRFVGGCGCDDTDDDDDEDDDDDDGAATGGAVVFVVVEGAVMVVVLTAAAPLLLPPPPLLPPASPPLTMVEGVAPIRSRADAIARGLWEEGGDRVR